MTLAARFEEWVHQHKEEGRKKGMEKGEARILQRLLVARSHKKPLLPSKVPARSTGGLDGSFSCSQDLVAVPADEASSHTKKVPAQRGRSSLTQKTYPFRV